MIGNNALTCALLVAAVIISSAGSNSIYKLASTKGHGSSSLFCLLYQGLCACYYLIQVLLHKDAISAFTLLSGIGTGCAFSLAAWCYVRALQNGSYVISVVLFNYASFLAIVYSALFLGERISHLRILGIIVLMFLIYLLTAKTNVQQSHEKYAKRSHLKWAVYILLVLLLNSIVRFLLRYQGVMRPDEGGGMLAVYFTVAALLSLVFLLLERQRFAAPLRPEIKRFLPLAVAMAICIGIGTSGQIAIPQYGLSASVQYPVLCCGTIAFGVLAGRVLFHERPKKSVYGLILASILTIVFSCMF